MEMGLKNHVLKQAKLSYQQYFAYLQSSSPHQPCVGVRVKISHHDESSLELTGLLALDPPMIKWQLVEPYPCVLQELHHGHLILQAYPQSCHYQIELTLPLSVP